MQCDNRVHLKPCVRIRKSNCSNGEHLRVEGGRQCAPVCVFCLERLQWIDFKLECVSIEFTKLLNWISKLKLLNSKPSLGAIQRDNRDAWELRKQSVIEWVCVRPDRRVASSAVIWRLPLDLPLERRWIASDLLANWKRITSDTRQWLACSVYPVNISNSK